MTNVQHESGKMVPASKFGKTDASAEKLELTPEELKMGETLKVSTFCLQQADLYYVLTDTYVACQSVFQIM